MARNNDLISGWRVIGASGVASSVTGTTSETSLAAIVVPAKGMGANGIVRVTAHWSYTNSANNKIVRVRFGNGLSGTACLSITNTTTAQALYQIRIHNRNSTASQVVAQITGIDSTTTSAVTAPTIDTTTDQTITLSGTLANTGETITLESYIVELLYQI